MFKIPSFSFSPTLLIPSFVTNNRLVNGISSGAQKVLSVASYITPKYLSGKYSLHEASSVGNIASIRASLERGEDINALDSSGKSPLHHAILAGKLNTINFLLDNGADFNEKYTGKTPFHLLAASSNDFNTAKLFLEKGAKIDAVDETGCSVLHQYCQSKDPNAKRIISLLLEKGANVNLQDDLGYTPLHFAFRCGTLEVVNLLLDHPKIDLNLPLYLKNQPLFRSATPFHFVCLSGSFSLISRFIEKGADLNAKTAEGMTPLHFAVGRNDSKEIIKLLIENGALVETSSKTSTPLHIALREKLISTAGILLAKGAHPFTLDSSKKTPIEIARENKYFKFADKANEMYKHDWRAVTVQVRDDQGNFIANAEGKPQKFSCVEDTATTDIYLQESPKALAAKSFIVFSMTLPFTLGVMVANLVKVINDLGKIVMKVISERKLGAFYTVKNFAISIAKDIPLAILKRIQRCISAPFYSVKMLYSSICGVFSPEEGRKKMNQIEKVWDEFGLLRLTGMKKMGDLNNSLIAGRAKVLLV